MFKKLIIDKFIVFYLKKSSVYVSLYAIGQKTYNEKENFDG